MELVSASTLRKRFTLPMASSKMVAMIPPCACPGGPVYLRESLNSQMARRAASSRKNFRRMPSALSLPQAKQWFLRGLGLPAIACPCEILCLAILEILAFSSQRSAFSPDRAAYFPTKPFATQRNGGSGGNKIEQVVCNRFVLKYFNFVALFLGSPLFTPFLCIAKVLVGHTRMSRG